jgi:hypothetical protein
VYKIGKILYGRKGTPLSTVPALLVATICAWFTVRVLGGYLRHQRTSHLFWTIALAASAIASLAYFITIQTSPHSPVWFFIYYLLGAMWMPAIMGLGSLALVLSKRWVYGLAAVVFVVGAAGSVMMFRQPYSADKLAALAGGAGTGIIQPGAWLVLLIVLNTFGAAAVIGVALWSAWKYMRDKNISRFFFGNVWLALGVLVISSAGSAARLGWPGTFWVVMLAGWIITYIGYAHLSTYAHLSPRHYVRGQVETD